MRMRRAARRGPDAPRADGTSGPPDPLLTPPNDHPGDMMANRPLRWGFLAVIGAWAPLRSRSP